MIDGVVFVPIHLLDYYLLDAERGRYTLVVWGLLSYSAYWVYSVSLHARYGQTLGKMATKVRVLDRSEERVPSVRQAFIRDSPYIVLNALSLLWFLYLVLSGHCTSWIDIVSGPGMVMLVGNFVLLLVEVITVLTNSKRRALHDFIAGTIVVRVVPPTANETARPMQ